MSRWQTFHAPYFKNPGYKLNNALHFVELQDIEWCQKCCYFFPAWEMLSLIQVITKAIVFANTARFSIAAGLCKIGLFLLEVYFLLLDGSTEMKGKWK